MTLNNTENINILSNIGPKKSRAENINLTSIKIFWEAPIEAMFGQEVIAQVVNCSIKTLESDRWRGLGIPYRKCSGRVLYRKSDVVAWLEDHELVNSTS